MFDCLCKKDDSFSSEIQSSGFNSRMSKRGQKISLRRLLSQSQVDHFDVSTHRMPNIGESQIVQAVPRSGSFPVTVHSEDDRTHLVVAAKEQELNSLKMQEQVLVQRINQLDNMYHTEIRPLQVKCEQLKSANNIRAQQIMILNDRVKILQRHNPN